MKLFIVLVWTFGTWFLSARKWFTGPIRQIQAEEMGIDIDEPGKLEQAEAEGRLPSNVTESKD